MSSRTLRRRTARACDQCRRRKTRCDGELGCTACCLFGLECSFGHKVRQSRDPAYIAMLEEKVRDLEERLRAASKNVSGDSSSRSTSGAFLTNSSSGSHCQPNCASPTSPTLSETPNSSFTEAPAILERLESSCGSPLQHIVARDTSRSNTPTQIIPSQDISRESSYGSTHVEEKPLGLDILHQLCASMDRRPSLTVEGLPPVAFEMLNCSLGMDSIEMCSALPEQTETKRLVAIVFSEALHLCPFLARAHVDKALSKVYRSPALQRQQSDRDDLALLFAIVALGRRLDMSVAMLSYSRRHQGLEYFATAQQMAPLSACGRSLTTLQATLCMTLYLQAASALDSAHDYITASTSAAIRMGLHKRVQHLSPDECALRRRIWSSIRIFDVYVSATLGVPYTAVTDEGHTAQAFPPLSQDFSSAQKEVCEAHAELVGILGRGMKSIAFFRSNNHSQESSLRAVSNVLSSWASTTLTSLPPLEAMSREQLLLLYAYDYVQILLYSPLLISLASHQREATQTLYGKICIASAIHAIQVIEILQSRNQFNEASGFSMNALAFTTIVLKFGASRCADSSLASNSARTANVILLSLSNQNPAAMELLLAGPSPPPAVWWNSFIDNHDAMDGSIVASSPIYHPIIEAAAADTWNV